METAYRVFILLVLLSGLLISAGIAFRNGSPNGTDFYYHLKYAEKYANGQMALFDPQLMENNKGPYPPLFHLLLAIPVFLGFGIQFGALLQAILYPLVLLSTAFLVFKLGGLKPAAFTAVVLLSAVAFFDRGGQVTPQSVDVIFMPIAAFAFFKRKELLFLVSTAVMAYSHAPYSFLLLAPFLLYAFWKNFNKNAVFKAVAVSLPIALLVLWFLPSMLSAAGGVNTTQEQLIYHDPFYLLAFIGPPLFVVFLISVFYFFKRKEAAVPDEENGLKQFGLLWLACLTPLLLVFPDRFASYAAQPIAVFSGLVLGRIIAKPWKILFVLSVLLLLGWLYNTIPYWNLLLEGRLVPVP